MFRLHPSHRLPLFYCRNVSFGACRTAPRPLVVSGNPCRLVASSAATPRTRKSGKTKTILKLSDLPQGPVPGQAQPALEIDRDDKKPHTVVEQARQNMRKFENCVLLTRVGGFYELYHEHAEEYGPLLNLKVAVKKMVAGDVSMVRNGPPKCPQSSSSFLSSSQAVVEPRKADDSDARLAFHAFNWIGT